jgi:hypothetical protein
MAQGKDPVTRTSGGTRTHEIEAEIDRTRAAMDRTVDAIAGRLTPQELALEALGAFRDGSSALATWVVQTAREHPVPATIIGVGIGLLLTEKSRGGAEPRAEGRQVGFGSPAGYPSYMSTAGEGVRAEDAAVGAMHANEGAAGAVRDKAAGVKDTVAAGAVHAKDKAVETAGQVREQAAHLKDAAADKAAHLKDAAADKAAHLKEAAAETAGHVREQAAQVPMYARQQWHDAKLGFWQTMDQRPFAIGAAALAAGVAAGLTVPASRKERELMGETRDRLLDQARGFTREAMDKGKRVARVAGEVVKSEAERQGLTAGGLAEKVRTIGREAEQAVKTEAERAVDTLKATGTPMSSGGGGGEASPGGAAGRGMSSGFAQTQGSPTASAPLGSKVGTTDAGTTGTGTRTTGGSTGTTGTTTSAKGPSAKT